MSNPPPVENPRIQAFFREYYAGFSHYSPQRRAAGWPLSYDSYLCFEQIERNHYRILLQQLQWMTLGDKQILDVGCGEGNLLRRFLEWGAQPERLFGIDASETAIAEARRLSAAAMTFHHAMADALPFADASFDLICSRGVLIHIREADTIRAIGHELRRVIRPTGALLIQVYNEQVREIHHPWMRQQTRAFDRTTQELEGLLPDWQCVLRDDNAMDSIQPLLEFLATQEGNPAVTDALRSRTSDDALLLQGTWDFDIMRYCRTEQLGLSSLYVFRPR